MVRRPACDATGLWLITDRSQMCQVHDRSLSRPVGLQRLCQADDGHRRGDDRPALRRWQWRMVHALARVATCVRCRRHASLVRPDPRGSHDKTDSGSAAAPSSRTPIPARTCSARAWPTSSCPRPSPGSRPRLRRRPRRPPSAARTTSADPVPHPDSARRPLDHRRHGPERAFARLARPTRRSWHRMASTCRVQRSPLRRARRGVEETRLAPSPGQQSCDAASNRIYSGPPSWPPSAVPAASNFLDGPADGAARPRRSPTSRLRLL